MRLKAPNQENGTAKSGPVANQVIFIQTETDEGLKPKYCDTNVNDADLDNTLRKIPFVDSKDKSEKSVLKHL